MDHSLTRHVQAETRAGRIRRTRWPWIPRVAGALGVLFGACVAVLAVLAIVGVFDKASAPSTPDSLVHRIALELTRTGEADDYRAVEPDDGWDTEYELDDGDAYIRIRNEGTAVEEMEYEALFGDLDGAIEAAFEKRGYVFEE